MRVRHGYLLPDGDAFEGELDCALVFFPKRDEYRRALLGALTYFEKWNAWELDSGKRGKDAARAWALANVCTLECWNMACIDELLETMEAVRVMLSTRKDCCDDNVTYGIQVEQETEIIPRDGDPPGYYGETVITDWDDWAEHVCYNAHLYVDNLKNLADQMSGAVQQNSLYLGLIAAGLVMLSFSGIGLPVAFLLASFVVTGLAITATSATFASTAQDIEDARELIICSLLRGTGLAAAVEDALGSDAAWDLFYQFVDYDTATAIIYEGGANGEFLPAETRDDCGCTEGYEMIVHEGWGWMVDQTHFSPEYAAGCWQTSLIAVVEEGTSNFVLFKIISVDVIAGKCSTWAIYKAWNWAEELIYESDTPPSNLSGVKLFATKHANDAPNKEILWTLE